MLVASVTAPVVTLAYAGEPAECADQLEKRREENVAYLPPESVLRGG